MVVHRAGSHTGMKAQQAELLTRVPSGQTAVGAAVTTAARATKAMREVKAIDTDDGRPEVERTGCPGELPSDEFAFIPCSTIDVGGTLHLGNLSTTSNSTRRANKISTISEFA